MALKNPRDRGLRYFGRKACEPLGCMPIYGRPFLRTQPRPMSYCGYDERGLKRKLQIAAKERVIKILSYRIIYDS